MAEHPDEIAFVLCHEFGHIRASHSVKTIERRKGNEFLAGAVLVLGAAAAGAASADPYSQVDSRQAMDNAINAYHNIIASFSPHRRQDEYEADAQAIDLMAAAGYPLERCGDWFEHMISMYGTDDGSESHPPTQERLKRIRQIVAARQEDYRASRYLSLDDFREMQARIRSLTVQLLEADRLAFYTLETLEQEAAGRSVAHAKACGPLEADVQHMVQKYVERFVELD